MARISRPSDIQFFRRGTRTLVVHPPTCSWLVCDAEAARWFETLPVEPQNATIDEDRSDPSHSYFTWAFYEAGLLSCNGEMKYPPDLFADDLRPLSTVVFNVTNGCNLRCCYCYANSTTGKQMAFPVVKRALDLVSESADRINIQFSGNGEPLLNWPLLCKSFAYCNHLRDQGKQIKITVQTNGTLVSRETALRLKENVDRTVVSIDGPRGFTDRHRVFAGGGGAFDRIMRGIEILRDVGAPLELSATVVACQDLPEVIDWLLKSEVSHITHNFLWPQGRGERCEMPDRPPELWLELHTDLFRTLVSHNRQASSPVTHRTVRQWVTNLVSKKRMSKCHRSPCGAGTEMISVDADGNIYPCHAMTTPPLCIGNVLRLDADERHPLAKLQSESTLVQCLAARRVAGIEECSTCAFRFACGGPCANDTYTEHKRIINALARPCGARKRVFEELAWLLSEHRDHPYLLMGMTPSPAES